jgi:hypothetical protein
VRKLLNVESMMRSNIANENNHSNISDTRRTSPTKALKKRLKTDNELFVGSVLRTGGPCCPRRSLAVPDKTGT